MALPDLGELGFPAAGPAAGPAVEPEPTEAKEEPLEEEEPEESARVVKVSPTLAGYRDTMVSCGECRHWQSPASCRIVDGPIAIDGTCNLAEAGEGAMEDVEAVGEAEED